MHLIPHAGYFIALVVVGSKEEDQVQMMCARGAVSSYVTALYSKTPFSAGGRWLMIQVRDQAVLDDVKELMAIRVRPQKVRPDLIKERGHTSLGGMSPL